VIAAFLENLESLESLEMSLSGSQPKMKEKSGKYQGKWESVVRQKCVCGRTDRFTDAFITVLPFATGGVKKGKVFPYSLPSVGPGADPGVQAVSPQVT